MRQTLDDLLKKETGSGIGIVIYGIVVLLALTLVGINILNAKIIQDGYDRLRDSLDAAVAGSVLHIALDNDQKDEIVSTDSYTYDTSDAGYTFQYDPWLQLALGFLMRSDSDDNDGTALVGDEAVANDFIKFDRKKVVTHTMRILQDGVLGNYRNMIDNPEDYQILMIFLEPAYDNNLDKSIDIIVYDSSMFTMDGNNIMPADGKNGRPDRFKGRYYRADGLDDTSLMNSVNDVIGEIINEDAIFNSDKDYNINLIADEDLVEGLKTRPYYFVIVKDFALPTLFGDTKNENVFVDLNVTGDGHVGPMFALQGANTKRRVAETMREVVK